MVPKLRNQFNRAFTDEGYERYASRLAERAGVPIEFRLSETPCFFPKDLLDRLIEVSHLLIGQLLDNPAYRTAAEGVVPDAFRVANGEDMPTCLQVDFGLVRRGDVVEGRLVELQAFPSLYGFQMAMAETAQEVWPLEGTRAFLGGLDHDAYVALMRRVFVGSHEPAEVVLMEIDPTHQKTRPDFAVTEQTWGIRAVDFSEVVRDGRRLFYRRDGTLTPISRIYNRVIPDELEKSGTTMQFDYRDDLDVEWIGTPDWFFRISKFSLPWLRHPWVPTTTFLSDVHDFPADRENWLLKPLFSFAGGGIVFAPTDAQLCAIPERERHLYVLQERVQFTPVIETPFGPTQAEVRIMMVRDAAGYRAVMPLVRMGRGRMMGVDHNKGLTWVGAAAGLECTPD